VGSVGRILVVWALQSGCLDSPDSAPPADDLCGTLRSVSDEFDGPLSEWDWALEGMGSSNGTQVVLTPALDSTSALFSLQSWRVDGDLVVELDPKMVAPDATLEVWLSSVDESRLVGLSLGEGTLSAMVYQPSYGGSRDTVEFDPAMRWWRIGRANDRFHWATSVDGVDWTEQGDFDAELSGLAGLAISLTARTVESSAAIEAVNPGGALEPFCPLSSFTDDFAMASPRWFIYDDIGCLVEFGERADISLSQAGACGLSAYERFSFADGEVSVELAEARDCSMSPSFEIIGEDAGFSYVCGFDGESAWLTAVFANDGDTSEVASGLWNAERFRFLRIHHVAADGAVVFETSGDGLDWELFGTASPVDSADLSSMVVSLAGYAEGPGEAGIAFDQLNLPADSE